MCVIRSTYLRTDNLSLGAVPVCGVHACFNGQEA